LESAAAWTVRVAEAAEPLKAAVSVTLFVAATADVETGNVPLLWPAAMVTLAGTDAAALLLLESVTFQPPAGAGPFIVTVPVAPVPPIKDVELRETPLTAAATTVSIAVSELPA
jgi:hypothetical protein